MSINDWFDFHCVTSAPGSEHIFLPYANPMRAVDFTSDNIKLRVYLPPKPTHYECADAIMAAAEHISSAGEAGLDAFLRTSPGSEAGHLRAYVQICMSDGETQIPKECAVLLYLLWLYIAPERAELLLDGVSSIDIANNPAKHIPGTVYFSNTGTHLEAQFGGGGMSDGGIQVGPLIGIVHMLWFTSPVQFMPGVTPDAVADVRGYELFDVAHGL
jgi:hypothetical protein